MGPAADPRSFRPRGQRRCGAVVRTWPGSSPLRQAWSSSIYITSPSAGRLAGTGQQRGAYGWPYGTCRHLMVPRRSRSRSRAPGRRPFRPREITSTFHAIDASFARAACCTTRRKGARRRPLVASVVERERAALFRGRRLQRGVAARSEFRSLCPRSRPVAAGSPFARGRNGTATIRWTLCLFRKVSSGSLLDGVEPALLLSCSTAWTWRSTSTSAPSPRRGRPSPRAGVGERAEERIRNSRRGAASITAESTRY